MEKNVIPQIPCSNRFQTLTDVKELDTKSQINNRREENYDKCNIRFRYSAKHYPLSRKHFKQMNTCNKSKIKKDKVAKRNVKLSSNCSESLLKCPPVRQCGGGTNSVAFREKVVNVVSTEYALDILSQCIEGVFENELISTAAPVKPKGGELFVIDTESFSNKLSRRVDQYQWVNDGSKKHPASDPKIIKTCWRIKTTTGNSKNPKGSGSNAFKRVEFGLIGNNRYFLVQYTGDESVFEEMPHGNAKHSTKNYVRTCPSLVDSIKETLETGLTSGKVYNKLKSEVDGQSAVTQAPRNLKQVQNLYMSMQRKKRLSQDDLYNTLELAYQLDGFVMQFDIFPSLLLVLGLKEAVKDFNDLLHIQKAEKTFLSIDTTFETGNLYITPIVYKNFLFRNEPTIPLAFLTHEKKDQKFQERFLTVLSQECPNLKTKETIFVADREKALTNAISQKLPCATIVHCWNHVKRDVREWLKRRKAPTSNIDVYMSNLETLLRSESENDFHNKFEEFSETWCKSFLDYFNQHIKSEILQHSGRWILEEHNVYNPYSGVTTNISEGFNNVIKWVNDHKRLPVDNMVLSLFYLQNSCFSEVLRGRAGLGNYTLKEEFRFAAMNPEELKFPHKVVQPDDILDTIKNNMSSFSNPLSDILQDSGEFRKCDVAFEGHTDNIENFDTTTGTTTLDEAENLGKAPFDSQESLAEKVVANGGVKLVSEMEAFMVRGLGGKKIRLLCIRKKSVSVLRPQHVTIF